MGTPEDEINETSDIHNDFGADSIDEIEIIMKAEKEFGISIPDEAVENIKTVKEAVDYLEERLIA